MGNQGNHNLELKQRQTKSCYIISIYIYIYIYDISLIGRGWGVRQLPEQLIEKIQIDRDKLNVYRNWKKMVLG